ncbi:RPA family protein, partial [Haladaptatus sp.]|uniref:RPA family protein n=1 Tax=Haladaptatus sp. TaxID=1973141 RepID=UPI003C608FF1
MSSQGGVGRREVAWRIFAAEYDGSSLEHSDSDEERAPNYVVTPTGARINRLFVVGVLTEIEQVGDEVLRARIVDPTGGFVVYAGQYQPDALAFLERAEAPMFVAVTGKARTFQPDDSDLVYTSIRPESMNAVDAETRDRWTVQTAQQTLDRIRTFAGALDSGQRGEDLRQALEAADVDTGLAAGVPLALDHYRTSTPYLAELQDVALDAARVVAGEQEEVGTLDMSPDEAGNVTLDVDVSLDTSAVDVEMETGTQTEPASEFDAEASNSETAVD